MTSFHFSTSGPRPTAPAEDGADPHGSEDETERFLDHAGVQGHEPSSFEQDLNHVEEPAKP